MDADKKRRLERLVERMERKALQRRIFCINGNLSALFAGRHSPSGTGAWTGALVAAFFDIRLRAAFPAILLGVVIAGILVTGLTFGFTEVFNCFAVSRCFL